MALMTSFSVTRSAGRARRTPPAAPLVVRTMLPRTSCCTILPACAGGMPRRLAMSAVRVGPTTARSTTVRMANWAARLSSIR